MKTSLRIIALLMSMLAATAVNAALLRIDFDGPTAFPSQDWTGPGPPPASFALSFIVDTLAFGSSNISYLDNGEISAYRFYGVGVRSVSFIANGSELWDDPTGLVLDFGGDSPNLEGGSCFCFLGYTPLGRSLGITYTGSIPSPGLLGADPLATILLTQTPINGQSVDVAGEWGSIVGFGPVTVSAVPLPAALDDRPVAVVAGVAKIIPVGSNDYGFTDPVTITVTSLPTKGTITAVSAPGPAAGMTITYTANVGAVGTDSFMYQMTDSSPGSDSATVTLHISPDSDGDGVADASDNCMLLPNNDPGTVPNMPGVQKSQLDSDHDGYGNVCDGDLNDSGLVTSQDSTLVRNLLNHIASDSPLAAAADLDGSGQVTVTDNTLLRNRLNSPPGPSGYGCGQPAGSAACP